LENLRLQDGCCQLQRGVEQRHKGEGCAGPIYGLGKRVEG